MIVIIIIMIVIISVSRSTEYNNNAGESYAKTSDFVSIPCTRHTAITKHYRGLGKLRFPPRDGGEFGGVQLGYTPNFM